MNVLVTVRPGAVGPGERHFERVAAVRQAEFRRRRREDRLVVRLVAARLPGRQARLEQELRVRRVGVEEPHRRLLRVVLVLRILPDVRADQFAAGEADIDVQHVGAMRTLPAPRRACESIRARYRGGAGAGAASPVIVGSSADRPSCGIASPVRRRRLPAAGRGRRGRRVVLHPGVEVEVQQEPEPDPEQHADLRVHARRAFRHRVVARPPQGWQRQMRLSASR